MVDKLKPVTIIFAIFTVFFVLGGVYVYCNSCGSYSGDAHMDDNGKTIDYSISGPATNYGYSVFSETKGTDMIYFYYDESYPVFFNEKYSQKEYFNVMKSMLERRGVSSSYVDSKGLVDVMKNGNNTIVFVTGALPDTIYDGTDSCAFATWMKKGGTVYWTGPEIGRYILTINGTEDLDKGFFGGNVNSSDQKLMAYNASPMFEFTQTRFDNCAYGLKADYVNSKPLAFISDDGYSSVSVAKLFNGNVFVVGGNMALLDNVSQAMTDRTCIADLMICGLTYASEGLEHGTGEFTNKVSATTKVDVSSYHDVAIWLTCGEPSSHWGKCIRNL